MFTVNKYLKLLSCANESDLDNEISKISESDAKQFMKTAIQFFQRQNHNTQDFFTGTLTGTNLHNR